MLWACFGRYLEVLTILLEPLARVFEFHYYVTLQDQFILPYATNQLLEFYCTF
jgi:hypothetical protein